MFKDILLTLVGLIGVAMIVVAVLSEKENKDKCNENKRVKEYNGVVLIGGIATVVIVLLLFFMGHGNKATTRFAFG
jgi:uncharacterized membrane protein